MVWRQKIAEVTEKMVKKSKTTIFLSHRKWKNDVKTKQKEKQKSFCCNIVVLGVIILDPLKMNEFTFLSIGVFMRHDTPVSLKIVVFKYQPY